MKVERVTPKPMRHRSCRDDDDDPRPRLREPARQRRRFRLPDIVDDLTRGCLAAVVDTSISGRRVAREEPNDAHGPRITSGVTKGWKRVTLARKGIYDAPPPARHRPRW
jgi:hypothetical protein